MPDYPPLPYPPRLNIPPDVWEVWCTAAYHDAAVDQWLHKEVHQLTTGAENWCFECEDVHPPGHHTDPEPCLCAYALFTTRFSLDDFRGPIIRRVVLGSYFTIHPACQHHGELNREWGWMNPWERPWETTLGPDETQP